MAKIVIGIERDGIKEQYILKKLESDPNTWHIVKTGEEESKKVKRLKVTYKYSPRIVVLPAGAHRHTKILA